MCVYTGHPNNVQWLSGTFSNFLLVAADCINISDVCIISRAGSSCMTPIGRHLKASPYIVYAKSNTFELRTIPLFLRLLALLYRAVYHHYAVGWCPEFVRFTVPIQSFGEPYRGW